jgi:hypothetical protein
LSQRIKSVKSFPHTNNQEQVIICSHQFVFCTNTELKPLVTKEVEGLTRSGLLPVAVSRYKAMITGYIRSLSPQRFTFASEQIPIALGNTANGA